ncbi:MAG: MFS transporter [Bacillota bacterium]
MKANKRVVISVLLMMLGMSMSVGIISMVLSDLVSEFSLVGAQQGYFGTFNSVGAMAALLSIFFLVGRVKKKTTMLIFAMTMMTIALFAIGSAKTFGAALIAYAFNGMGLGFMDSYSSSLIIDLQGKDSAKYMSMLHGCFAIGSLVSPILIQWILNGHTWRTVYFIYSGFLAVCVLQMAVSVFLARNAKTEAVAHSTQRITGADLREYLGDKANILFILMMFVNMGGQYGYVYYIVRYMSMDLNRADLAALALTLFWLTSVIARFLYPKLKLSALKTLLVCFLLSAGSLAAGILLQNGLMMFIASILAGFGVGPGVPLTFHEGGRRFARISSLPVTVMSIMINIARAVVPPLEGAVARAHSLQMAMLIAPLIFLGGAALSAALMRMLEKPAPKAL